MSRRSGDSLPAASACVVWCCQDLQTELAFLLQWGFRLEQIIPADDPQRMLLSGWGLDLELQRAQTSDPQSLVCRLPPASGLTQTECSPAGLQLRLQVNANNQMVWPATIDPIQTHFDADASWVTGRAGMLYRDLIPKRLGGAMIASNILIPNGGPVPDQVHFHNVDFQLICCVSGWVKVVYEDQGEPFILRAGDAVTQPPGIRHQVLEASDGLEVVEIGLPAAHMTTLDHGCQLPTGKHLPARSYQGQRFSHHQSEAADWQTWHAGIERCQTAVATDSAGLAALNFMRNANDSALVMNTKLEHADRLRFYYVIQGQLEVQMAAELQTMNQRDSWLLPPNQVVKWLSGSSDLQLMEFILLQ